VDLQANYRIGLPDYGVRGIGDVTLSFLGTVMSKYEVQPITNGDRFDCAGLYGPQCGGSSNAPVFPKWRHKMRVTWEMPWDASLSVAWRHMSSTQYEQISDQKVLQAAGSSPLSATLPQTNYFDLAAQWAPVSWLTLTGGVNNVFDKSPPIVGSGVVGLPFLNGNTLPQVYDIGRYFFFSASAKF
jgi:outer membrane receptor protein involved in Fe transport